MITLSPWRKRRRTLVAILLMAAIALALMASGPTQRARAEDSGGWRPIGPDGGADGAILVHPTDPNRIFISASDGLFRSDDGGDHWRTLYVRNTRIGAPRAVVLHPTDSDTLYALFRRETYPFDIEVFVSHDGGESWLFRFSPPRIDGYDSVVNPTLAIAPSEPGSLYLFANHRLYKSEDDGSSWKRLDVSGHEITSIVVAPADANIVYAITAGGSNIPSRILKSEDAGEHWFSLNRPGDWGIGTLAVHPTDPDTLFVSVDDGLHVSRDGGRTWSKTGLDVWRPWNINISPTNPTIMYATNWQSIFKSEDGGVNWRTIGDVLPDKRNSWGHYLAIHPTDPDTIFINGQTYYDFPDPPGNGIRGVFYKSIDGGDHWVQLSQGLPNGALSDFAISPATGALYAVGGLGAFRRDANSLSWVPINDGLGETSPVVYQIAISPGVPETLYIIGSSDDGDMAIYVSEDEGESWRRTGSITKSGPPRELIAAPTSPPALYLINGRGEIEKSWNGGASWTRLGGGGAPTFARGLVVDPTDPNRLYATDATGPWGSLLRTVNGGQRWRTVSLPAPPTEVGALEPLTVDPEGGVYVRQGMFGPLLRSDDHGENWETVDAPPLRSQLYAMAFDPADPAHMVIAADDGVSISWDRGRSWTSAGQPLSTFSPVRQIAMDPTNPQRLVAMNHWDGLYEREFALRKTLLPLIGGPGDETGSGQVDPAVSGAWVQSARLDPARGSRTVVQPQQLVTGLTHVQYWRGAEEETDPETFRVAVILTVGDRIADCLEFPYWGRFPSIPSFPGQNEEYAFAFVAPEEPGRYNLTASVVAGAPGFYHPLCPANDEWQPAPSLNTPRVIGEVVVQE